MIKGSIKKSDLDNFVSFFRYSKTGSAAVLMGGFNHLYNDKIKKAGSIPPMNQLPARGEVLRNS